MLAILAMAVSLSATAFGEDITQRGIRRPGRADLQGQHARQQKNLQRREEDGDQQNKLDKAAARFKQAAASLRRTITQLAALPQPSADQERLSKWLDYLERRARAS